MPDLRMPAVAAVVWMATLAGLFLGVWAVLVAAAAVALAAGLRRRTALILAVVALAMTLVAVLRVAMVEASPAHGLAQERASGTVEIEIRSDPRVVSGTFGSHVVMRANLRVLTARGSTHRLRIPVLLTAPMAWRTVPLGARVRAPARLAPSDSRELGAIVSARGSPQVQTTPGTLLSGAERVRQGIRDAVADQPAAPRALLPALVDGDDGRMSPELVADFRTTGLTHLTAVSGTNLTLLIGFLLIVARGLGVRARGLMVVGAFGVVGFVLLARTEPSVLRAAVMGSVALLGMGLGRAAGVRSLGVAVTVLLLLDPWMGLSPGFALSVLATAGILFLAPVWRDALMRWLPRWVAEAISVPLAAQVACTPIVAALSGELSLVAVAANLLVAPAVGPVTVCGLAGGLVATVWVAAGQVVAAPGAWCARWIIAVAEHGADLPVAAVPIATTTLALGLLTAATVALGLGLAWLLPRRGPVLLVVVLLGVLMAVPMPRPGWPPGHWVLVMCDIGQGDGLVLNAGGGEAVVVDAGPDPRAMDRCLDRLRIRHVRVVVLTHFHADHIDGLAGVWRGRRVDSMLVSPYTEGSAGAAETRELARRDGVPVAVAEPGQVRRDGELTWQVLEADPDPQAGAESPMNNSSVAILVRSRGLDLLLLGDQEPGAQARLRRDYPGLRADVLKVAHHGSARQDPALVTGIGARLAIVSAGQGNDYGHPAPSLLRMLGQAGIPLRRTDLDGDIAVIERDGLRVETSR